MKIKVGFYVAMAVVLIAGGLLLAAKGKDAVSQAESRKQGVLEAEQTTLFYQKSPGSIIKVNAAVGDSVKQGDVLMKVKSDEGGEVDVLAPDDGLINRMAVKPGDQLLGMPVAVLQKSTYYTDLYIQESEIQKLKVNQKNISVHFPYLDHITQVKGVVSSISAAPQFASLRMTREKGQADLSMFLVRIVIDSNSDLLPGMTAEVKLDELTD